MPLLRGPRQAERGWLIPGWLIEVVRPRREPVPWPAMLRSALAVCMPLAVAIAAGQPLYGLLAAIGGLLASVVDRGGPYLGRLRRIWLAAVLGGVPGLVAGSLIHGRGWVAVAVIVAIAGISALLSAVSATWSVASLQLLVYSSFGLGPLGALRPWWLAPVMMLAGVAWGSALLFPGWLLFPRAGEERAVAGVYQAIGRELRAVGTGDFPQERREVTAALNAAYDEFLTARLEASGRDRRATRLVALLNQAHLVTEAATALGQAGQRPPPDLIAVVDDLAAAIRGETPPPVVPAMIPPGPAGSSPAGSSPDRAALGLTALRDGAAGAAALLAGARPPATAPGTGDTRGAGTDRAARARRGAAGRVRQRIGHLAEQLRGGGPVWMFAARLMLCVGAAAVVSELAPLPRSYWIVLTVAIVLKPDFGSVFARALQRGIGTVVGAVLGAAVLAVVPYGPFLLVPLAVFAALLPYGRSRNYGLFAVFLTPLVVLLIDLLAGGGWRLAQIRLVDTLIGCAIVLGLGYAPWPASWYADLPRKLASALDGVAVYLERSLTGQTPARPASAAGEVPGARSRLRRQTYRALSDLRTEFQRTMAEPASVSRRAAAWWPALVALENVMDTVTVAALAIERGAAPPPDPAACGLGPALRDLAQSVRSGRPPGTPVPVPLRGDARAAPVTEAVRAVCAALADRPDEAG